MNIGELFEDLKKSSQKFSEKEGFDASLILMNLLFDSFWAYAHLVPQKVFVLVQELSAFSYEYKKDGKNFGTLDEKEVESQRRKLLMFLAFFDELLSHNPQIRDLELIHESEVKKSLRPFHLVVACVANVGRSPALEQSISFISESVGLQLDVSSCGVVNLMGKPERERAKQPLLERMIGRVIQGKGVGVSSDMCNRADLILTAAPYISDKIIVANPDAKKKVLTAKEFVSRYNISEKGFSYAFYIDDPAFSVQREKALDKWMSEKKGSIKDFMQTTAKDIAEGRQKPFLYKNKYPEGESARGESTSIRELLKLSFAIVERLIHDNYLTTKPEVRSLLLFKLETLRKRVI